MAEWSRKKVNSGNINNGKEYEKDDNVVREQLNAMINTGLYSQDFAEKLVTNIDTSEVGNVGTPSVSLITGDGATTDKPYKKFKFSNLKGATGATGNGIISISKTGTSKLVDTYTISFTSGATTTFQVTNGKGITKIEKTATSGLVDTYTITFNDTTTSTFQVTNGAKGDKGDIGMTPNITATATTLPAGSSATVTKSGTAENPAFAFGIPKGDKGDKGEKGERGESGTIVSVAGEEKTSINTDTTPTANSENLVTSGGVHDYPAIKFAEEERQKSKNLLDKSTLKTGAYLFVDGTYQNLTDYVTFDPISVIPNSTITVSCPNFVSVGSSGFVFFKDGAYISGASSSSFTTTVPANANQVIYNFNMAGITLDIVQNAQLEYGAVATDYQPYNGAIVHEKELDDYLADKKGTIANYTDSNHTNSLDLLYEGGVYSYFNPTSLPSGIAEYGTAVIFDGNNYKAQMLLGNYGDTRLAIRPLDSQTGKWATDWKVLGLTHGTATLSRRVFKSGEIKWARYGRLVVVNISDLVYNPNVAIYHNDPYASGLPPIGENIVNIMYARNRNLGNNRFAITRSDDNTQSYIVDWYDDFTSSDRDSYFGTFAYYTYSGE